MRTLAIAAERERGARPSKRGAQCREEEEEKRLLIPTVSARRQETQRRRRRRRLRRVRRQPGQDHPPKTNGQNSVRCGRRRRSVLYCCQRKKFGGNRSREDDWSERQVPSAHWRPGLPPQPRTWPTWHARSEGDSMRVDGETDLITCSDTTKIILTGKCLLTKEANDVKQGNFWTDGMSKVTKLHAAYYCFICLSKFQ